MGKKKRKRIQSIPSTYNYRAGDLVKAEIPGVPGTHICIILDESDTNQHYRCVRVCNFTGSEIPEGEYAIDIRLHHLPNQWFGNKKPTSWIRCNREIDCINSFDIVDHKVLGNIKDDYRDLWLEVCEKIKNCDISVNFNTVCECAFEA